MLRPLGLSWARICNRFRILVLDDKGREDVRRQRCDMRAGQGRITPASACRLRRKKRPRDFRHAGKIDQRIVIGFGDRACHRRPRCHAEGPDRDILKMRGIAVVRRRISDEENRRSEFVASMRSRDVTQIRIDVDHCAT